MQKRDRGKNAFDRFMIVVGLVEGNKLTFIRSERECKRAERDNNTVEA